MSGTGPLDSFTVTGPLTGCTGAISPTSCFLTSLRRRLISRTRRWGRVSTDTSPSAVDASAPKSRPTARRCNLPAHVCIFLLLVRKQPLQQPGGWGAVTDSRGRVSRVRHPFRGVCTHSIYKCHRGPTRPHKASSDGLLQTYNSR